MNVLLAFYRNCWRSAIQRAACAGLLLVGVGCERISSLAKTAPAKPLAEVLPGRWQIVERGLTYNVAFGTHSEVSCVVDVPQQYQARLGVQQIWLGGNYHLNGQTLDCQFTDGRWAVILAQMHGLQMHHLGIESFSEDQIVDADKTVWKRTGPAPEGHAGVVDIADRPLPGAALAPSVPPPSAAEQARLKKLRVKQARLAAAYAKLEARRKSLDPANPAAVAAFNKVAADYTRQVAELNADTAPPTTSR